MEITEFPFEVIEDRNGFKKCLAIFVTEEHADRFATLHNMIAQEMEDKTVYSVVKLPGVK